MRVPALNQQFLEEMQVKRSRVETIEMSTSQARAGSSATVHDSMQGRPRPGIGVVDVGEELVLKILTNLPRLADLSLVESFSEEKRQDVDFNDRFPDEILLQIFKYNWRPAHCWDTAKVCKQWCILQAFNLLQKRSNYMSGRYPCIGLKRTDRTGRESHCDGFSKVLKLRNVDSEWRLAMDFLKSCKRHTHSLEIKDCTNVSVRGYQLISAFASNLKSVRLASCNTMDDPSFDAILNRCRSLRSIHISMVPKLSLRNVEKNAFKLQELVVYGCPTVTTTTVMSILKGCPNLRSLCLSAMGVGNSVHDKKFWLSEPLRLQTLELSNTLGVTDGFLCGISNSLRNLSRLDLTLCPSISDDGLKAVITSSGSGLEKLVLTRCLGVSDDSARALASTAVNLRDVSLAGTNVTDDGVLALIKSDRVSSKLRNLSLAGCLRVTDASVRHVVSIQGQLVSLKTVDVQSCPAVSMTWPKVLRAGKDRHVLKLLSS